MRIKVMIVDDHAVVRLGIQSALKSDPEIEVVGEASDGASAIRDAAVLIPDVVLMDVLMPGTDGIQACRAIREARNETRVLILTSYTDQEAVMSAIAAGASGYILKNTGPAALVRAVKSVHGGGSLLDPDVTQGVLDEMRRMLTGQQDPGLSELSKRELEVLSLLGRGMTNQDIADQLVLSVNTARNHVSSVLAKLGVARRSEAAALAAEHGLTRRDQASR